MPVVEEHKNSIAEKSEKAARNAGIIVVSAGIRLILLYWIFRKKEPEKLATNSAAITEQPSVESLLEPAYAVIARRRQQFYSILHNIIWKFVSRSNFNLSGSEMNKQILADKMKEANCNERYYRQFIQDTGRM